MIQLPRLQALRYLQPLREGGSLPAVVETDGGLYVVKFRGAGQGPLALVAEVVVGLIAMELGLRVPALARVELPEGFGSDQRDPEIRELLAASTGPNIGLRYLDGAFNFDANAADDLLGPGEAAAIVWLDALTTNPDRTARNPNLMVWDRRLWLIDHGSALYAHHAWSKVDEERERAAFPLIREHVLLTRAAELEATDAHLAAVLTPDRLEAVMAAVPESLLMHPLAKGELATVEEARARYTRYLTRRLAAPRTWVAKASETRARRLDTPPDKLDVRR